MPTYEYACSTCKHEWELEQSIKENAATECPSCHEQTAKRQISRGGGFILKGGGWYADLYSSSGNKPAEGKPAEGDTKSSGSDAKPSGSTGSGSGGDSGSGSSSEGSGSGGTSGSSGSTPAPAAGSGSSSSAKSATAAPA
jgi:putative FmdB family regulatory protein